MLNKLLYLHATSHQMLFVSQSLAPLYDLPTFHNLTNLKLGMDDNVGWKLLPNLLQSSPNLKVLVFKDVSMDFFFSPCWDDGLIPMGKYCCTPSNVHKYSHFLWYIWTVCIDSVNLSLPDSYISSWPKCSSKFLNYFCSLPGQGLVKPFSKGTLQFNWNPRSCVPHCLLLHLKTIEIHNFLGTPDEVKLVTYLLGHATVLEMMTIYWYDTIMDSESQKTMVKTKVDILKSPRGSYTCQVIFHHLMY